MDGLWITWSVLRYDQSKQLRQGRVNQHVYNFLIITNPLVTMVTIAHVQHLRYNLW